MQCTFHCPPPTPRLHRHSIDTYGYDNAKNLAIEFSKGLRNDDYSKNKEYTLNDPKILKYRLRKIKKMIGHITENINFGENDYIPVKMDESDRQNIIRYYVEHQLKTCGKLKEEYDELSKALVNIVVS